MTRNMEISVPRLRHWPMPTMDGSVVICPMRKPAADRMEPEVSIVEKTSFQVKLPATPIASQRLSGTTFVNGRVRGRISGFVDAEIHGVVKGDISAIMSSGSYDLPEGSGQPPEAGASPEDTPNTPPADSVTGKEGDAQ